MSSQQPNNTSAGPFSLIDFADGIKFSIFAFSHGNELHEEGPVAKLFKSFGFLSKDCYRSCINYVQQIAMVYPGVRDDGPIMEAFLCRNRVKIGKIDLALTSSLSRCLSIYILRSCDLTDLHSIYISDIDADQSSEEHISDAINAGIPDEVIQEFHPATIEPLDRRVIQKIIADILTLEAPSLTKMEVLIKKEQWHRPLLTNFSNRLEELHLQLDWDSEIAGIHFPYDEGAKQISAVIEHMLNLKRLNLKVYSLLISGRFRIKSISLEEIDTRWSKNFYIDECVCPSLKMLKGINIPRRQGNGVKPVTPFTEDDLKPPERAPNTPPHKFTYFVDFKVGERPFIGMTVPDSCIVRFNVK